MELIDEWNAYVLSEKRKKRIIRTYVKVLNILAILSVIALGWLLVMFIL